MMTTEVFTERPGKGTYPIDVSLSTEDARILKAMCDRVVEYFEFPKSGKYTIALRHRKNDLLMSARGSNGNASSKEIMVCVNPESGKKALEEGFVRVRSAEDTARLEYTRMFHEYWASCLSTGEKGTLPNILLIDLNYDYVFKGQPTTLLSNLRYFYSSNIIANNKNILYAG